MPVSNIIKKCLPAIMLLFTSYYAKCQTNTFPSDGSVGIGTLSPGSKLHIVGGGLTVGTNAAANNADGALSIGNIANSYTPTTSNWTSNGSTLILSSASYSVLAFHHSGLRVDYIRSGSGTMQLGYDGGWGEANIGLPGSGIWNSSGNVGIGTTTPNQGKLQISGSGDLLTLSSNGSQPAQFNAYNDTDFRMVQRENAMMTFWTNNIERIRIDKNGNVGIGTANPQSLLAVNGQISTKSVVVSLSGWADFVFKDNYSLMPITKLESFIKTNKHLPGVEKESEVLRNGIDLGEMNKRLLKKVEELTLYVIQEHKSNQKLTQEVKAIRAQMVSRKGI